MGCKEELDKYTKIVKRMDEYKMPERVRAMVLFLLGYNKITKDIMLDAFTETDFDYSKCESPAEIIFNVAFDYTKQDQRLEKQFRLRPQYDIIANGENYRADFVLEYLNGDGEWITTNMTIEVDGYEEHNSTQEKVTEDRIRDFNMKMDGWDVTRYTGQQVYADPLQLTINYMRYAQKKLS